jgi:transposase-like protein
MKRRTLISFALRATTLAPFCSVRLAAAIQEFPTGSLASLRRVARVVLPSALGARGVDDQVEQLARWVREYREGAELDHGYGRPRVRYAPPSPVELYVKQLEEIDAAAREKGRRFDRLEPETQRTLLDQSLKKAGADALPARPAGRHVVADLMTLYFRSSKANDVAYRAAIGSKTCRPITFVVNRPRSL